jgi:hypothetical protein
MSAVVELPPLDRWIARVRQIVAHRPHQADYAAYERFKADLVRDFPCLTGAEYDRAVAAIAKATGV